ncbi:MULTISPECIES: hypothetical protein [Streptomyces]|uniref:hypothetical protein n=1 Tax=Streptomyces TaxID=1883 RepID=UPI0018FE8D33|nr:MULTISPECIES: hypothetical protein [Streptomyces]
MSPTVTSTTLPAAAGGAQRALRLWESGVDPWKASDAASRPVVATPRTTAAATTAIASHLAR